MEFYIDKNAEYFQNLDKILETTNPLYNKNNELNNYSKDYNELPKKQYYEFIPFHPASITSEMIGTSIEELYQHNYPNKRSWECSRLCIFPQEIIVRFNYRAHIKFILIRAKIDRSIPEVNFYIGDGLSGSYLDTSFRKFASSRKIDEEGVTIKVDGIGTYLKIIFTNQPNKTIENPFGQVGLSQLKLFGKQVNYLLYYNESIINNYNDDEQNKNNNIDSILISLGLPLNDPIFFLTNDNYEIAPVDNDTKWTIKDMLEILKRAESSKDYEMMKKIKTDLKRIYFLGNEILNLERKLSFAKSTNNFDLCIEIREKLQYIKKKRDDYDVIYETSRFESMISLKRPLTADLLADEEERLRKLKEEKEKELKIKLEKEKKLKELNLEKEKLNSTSCTKYIDNSKFVDYIYTSKANKKGEFFNELAYNQGDKDLEPYFNTLVKKSKTKLTVASKTKLERLKRLNILNVGGVRLFSALFSDDWTLREASVIAFKDFISNPLLPRYFNKTLHLFDCAIEISKYCVEDKVSRIYIEAIKLIELCLYPPVCGNDIPPQHIQKQVKYFIPIIIKKISELNLRQRDNSLAILINIFKHPALNIIIGDLVKACMDIIEKGDGVTPDKQPYYTILARLEIILRILENYGIDESLWNWYPVFNELVVPSFFHSSPDVKLLAQQITILLYQLIGDDVKIIIEDPNKNIKPLIKSQILLRIKEIDNTFNKCMNNTLTSTNIKNISIDTNYNTNNYDKNIKSSNIKSLENNEINNNSIIINENKLPIILEAEDEYNLNTKTLSLKNSNKLSNS